MKIKENTELRNKIEKLKEEKVKGLNIIDDLTKSHEDLNTVPKMPQKVRKVDDKARTFAPSDNDHEAKKSLKELTRLKYPDDSIKFNKFSFDKIKRPKDLERGKFL